MKSSRQPLTAIDRLPLLFIVFTDISFYILYSYARGIVNKILTKPEY